jgi:hypothetical protein
MSKKRKKKRQQEAKPAVEPREPAAVVQVAQATIKYESGLDAVLRRAREKVMRDLAGRTG